MSQSNQKPLRIAIVVGEVSGDTLGANLIRQFKALGINAEFEGIGGEQMIAEGFKSYYPMESLSIMGLVEVLKHLRSLFAIRNGLIDQWRKKPVDIFIGIDAPDFNLRVSEQIKKYQLPTKTVQYVSPSVWAWRQNRVHYIKKVCDLVLCLFPFEVEFYQKFNVPAVFVGHPLAQKLSLNPDSTASKTELGLNIQTSYIALLPGSRGGEIQRLLPVMLQSVILINQQRPDLHFIIPAINQKRAIQIKQIFEQILQQVDSTQRVILSEKIQIIENNNAESNIGRQVMQASDAVILASGTATLEALLLHRPMVVVYKLNTLTYYIAKLLVKIPHYSLPNILAKKALVTELIQHEASPKNISQNLLLLLQTEQGIKQQQSLVALHHVLKEDISITDPVQAILKLL